MFKILLCVLFAISAVRADAAKVKKRKPRPAAKTVERQVNDLPQLWRLKDDAGRFTRLTAFPEEWSVYRAKLREKMWRLFGTKYDPALPLDCQEINSFQHGGITLKNIIYQTAPGVYTTATLYLPPGKGPFPALINMQGHWATGRLAGRVQQRGFAFAKRGYIVLSPDTFGQGERSVIHTKYAYHGRDLGAQLYHIGETLAGAQLVDNMRGVDLLCSLPEVDKRCIGATGASGGGNQTMYLAAMDDRIKAAMTVCSTGNYEIFLKSVNCVCETIPDGLTETELAGILAMTAPRALLICIGAKDVKAFSPREMQRSFHAALPVYKKLGAEKNFANRIFDHGHIFSPEIIASGIGWFDLHLKGKGDGSAVQLPEFTTLPEERLLAFAPGKRPEKVASIASYAARKGGELRKKLYSAREISVADARRGLAGCLRFTGGGKVTASTECTPVKGWKRFQLEIDGTKYLPLLIFEGRGDIVLALHSKGKGWIPQNAVNRFLASGATLAAVDLSYQGENGNKKPDRGIDYHEASRYAMWQGRTMAGVWTSELIAVKDFLRRRYPEKKITLHGFREMALPALAVSIFSGGIDNVVLEEAPVSYVFKKQTKFYNMSIFVPGILQWGDMPLAAALSPATVQWISPRDQDGSPAAAPDRETGLLKSKFSR